MSSYEPLSDRTAARLVVVSFFVIILILVALIFLVSSVALAQTTDAVFASSTPWDNTPVTQSLTISSGATGLVVQILGQGSPDSVKYNGVSMTYVGRSTGSSGVETWKMASPTSGTHDLVIYRHTYTFWHYFAVSVMNGGPDVICSVEFVAKCFLEGNYHCDLSASP